MEENAIAGNPFNYSTLCFKAGLPKPLPTQCVILQSHLSYLRCVMQGCCRAPPGAPIQRCMNHTAHRNHINLYLFQSKKTPSCHSRNTGLGAPLPEPLLLHCWICWPSFSLFGRGKAAVHLLAGLVERPLILFVACGGAVPFAGALVLPIACGGRDGDRR